MSNVNVYSVLHTILETIEPGNFSDETLEKLGVLFSDQLLLAALDLIDKDCVIKYVSPWGRHHFSVTGTTDSYAVFPTLHGSCSVPHFCTCTAFAFAVLISQSQLTVSISSSAPVPLFGAMGDIPGCFQCKHVLATLIAERLSKCVVREMGKDEFMALLERQNPDT
ncbi:hypothetical protein EI94DRAFT_1832806 [Lactarius quietus]|nr:hypothetical protein EI94DRAFT_1832806 [Lactarius quietus]